MSLGGWDFDKLIEWIDGIANNEIEYNKKSLKHWINKISYLIGKVDKSEINKNLRDAIEIFKKW